MDDLEIAHLEELEGVHFWYRARKAQLVNWLKNNLPLGALVLDLGSATGGNSQFMQGLGFKVISAEYSDLGVEIQKNKGLAVVQADAKNLPFNDEMFDAVVCMDVLEHIDDDKSAIKEVTRVLKAGGCFLISVPEDPQLWSKHDEAVNHYRRYMKDGLRHLLNEQYLQIDRLYSSMVILRPVVKIKRRWVRGSDLKRLPSLINIVLLGVCKFESLIGVGRLPGTTIWVWGKKKMS